jgi:methyl-accepting chemotaxis protein
MSAAQITYWHFDAAVRRENEQRQAEIAGEGAAQLRVARSVSAVSVR